MVGIKKLVHVLVNISNRSRVICTTLRDTVRDSEFFKFYKGLGTVGKTGSGGRI